MLVLVTEGISDSADQLGVDPWILCRPQKKRKKKKKRPSGMCERECVNRNEGPEGQIAYAQFVIRNESD